MRLRSLAPVAHTGHWCEGEGRAAAAAGLEVGRGAADGVLAQQERAGAARPEQLKGRGCCCVRVRRRLVHIYRYMPVIVEDLQHTGGIYKALRTAIPEERSE